MSHIYDNWERLVAAALRKQELWDLFHAQSRSPSISSDSSGFSFSFRLSSSLDDVPFGFSGALEEDSASNRKDDSEITGGRTSSISAKNQSTGVGIIPMELPVPEKKLSLAPRRRRKPLVIEVPKLNLQDHNLPCPDGSKPSRSPGRMRSPVPSSRTTHRVAVTQSNWADDGKHQSHPLPLPPVSNSAATSPSLAHSPGRAEKLISPSPRWKKGKLIARGSLGEIYVGFNSETGEMCAMTECMLYSNDANSKRNAKMLEQEVVMLSRLNHPNIVQYYGSEMVDEKLYLYYEYVSGGPISWILQEYGKLGESAIRSYTQQILSGLAYLHSKDTTHRNIKADSVLIDPSGSVKLANFGIAKHITRQSVPFSSVDSPYWMAPEFIRNSTECNQAVDIWSLGCTILEMATSRPPWSQYGEAVAIFKIMQAKELPEIPDHLSDEGKDFVRICLQWNPQYRPTASQLLEHPFVKSASPLGKQIVGHTSPTNSAKSMGIHPERTLHQSDSEKLAIHPSRVAKPNSHSSDLYTPRNISCPVSPGERRVIHSSQVSKPNSHSSDLYTPRNISCPVSPVGSPLLHPRSPQQLNGSSPPPISSPHMMSSGSSTPPAHQSALSQETFNLSKQQASARTDNPCYWDPNILQKVTLGRAINGELYGQSLLADRVTQRLLSNPVKSNPSRQFSPSNQF